MSDLTNISFKDVKSGNTDHMKNGSDHGQYVIGFMQVQFMSQTGKYVGATLEDGTWDVVTKDTAAIDPPEYKGGGKVADPEP